jgi:hypothetical protein
MLDMSPEHMSQQMIKQAKQQNGERLFVPAEAIGGCRPNGSKTASSAEDGREDERLI